MRKKKETSQFKKKRNNIHTKWCYIPAIIFKDEWWTTWQVYQKEKDVLKLEKETKIGHFYCEIFPRITMVENSEIVSLYYRLIRDFFYTAYTGKTLPHFH